MNQHERSLDVTKKFMPKAHAFVRAFDQSRNIRGHERRVPGVDHSKIGRQRGERVVRNLGTSRTDNR